MGTNELTEKIIGSAMNVHGNLGPGFLESVYKNALIHELAKSGIKAVAEKPISVYYDNTLVGEFFADLYVEDEIVIELKAVKALQKIHEVQTVNYLNAIQREIGLLINFGAESIEYKRKHRLYKKPSERIVS